MNTDVLTIGILADAKCRALAAFAGKADATPRYTFDSAEAITDP